VARHGLRGGGGERTGLMRRVALAVAFLVAVAVIPTLLVTIPGRGEGPAQAAPTRMPPPATTTPPPTTPAPTTTVATPRATPGPTTPRPAPATTPGGVQLPVAAPADTGPPPPRTPYQEFPSVCGRAGRGTQPVPPKAAVSGDWFGVAPGTGGTSCLTAGDRSTYWVPVVTQNGTPLAPQEAEVYYKSGIRSYDLVRPFPKGFTMLSPTAADARANGAFASWSCGTGDALTLPTSCPAGARLALRLQSPSCWDGRRLDSPGSRAHLAWPVQDRCPGGHPVPVPKLEMVVFYPLRAGALSLSLATGAGSTAVFRFVDNWDPAAAAKIIATCVNRGLRCDSQGQPT
jgi:hypothetical protein